MDADEKKFLMAMREIENIKECWLSGKRPYGFPSGQADTSAYLIWHLESRLIGSGRTIGLNARFEVRATNHPRSIQIISKNGAANRMLERYRNLTLAWELSDGQA